MKIGNQNQTNQLNQLQTKSWVGGSKIPVPGNGGVSFKDLAAVKGEFQKLKMGAVEKK